MITTEGSTKIVNNMTSGVRDLVPRCGHNSHIMKMHTFFKNLLLYTQAQIRQTEGRVMMTKEGSTKIVNFIILRAGVLVIGHGHISHIMKMNYFLNNPFLYS